MRKREHIGLSLSDYCEVFDLSPDDLKCVNLLEYGSGPTNVQAQLQNIAQSVVSFYPAFDMNEIKASEHELTEFLADYVQRQEEQRYQIMPESCKLPFDDFAFDMALSAYYLFHVFKTENIETHIAIITELARVAKEVRIFPLTNEEGEPSSILGPVLLALQAQNYGVEIRQVKQENQPYNKAMLRVFAQLCPVSTVDAV